jgi:juvenile-hormone esterase
MKCIESEIKESFFYFSKDPQPVEGWSEVLDATQEKMFCMQKNYLLPNPITMGVEDCLYLYVYRPKVSYVETS